MPNSFGGQGSSGAARPSRAGSPAPSRTTTGGSTARSTTVVGVGGHAPASMTSRAAFPAPRGWFPGRPAPRRLPGRISVDDRIGSPSSASSACTTAWSGTRTPTVLRLGCCNRRGNLPRRRQQEREADPACPWRTIRNCQLSSRAKWPIADRSRSTSVRWCASRRPRIGRIRRAVDRVADRATQRIARVRRVGDDAAVAQDRRRLADRRGCGLTGWIWKYCAMSDRRRSSLERRPRGVPDLPI